MSQSYTLTLSREQEQSLKQAARAASLSEEQMLVKVIAEGLKSHRSAVAGQSQSSRALSPMEILESARRRAADLKRKSRESIAAEYDRVAQAILSCAQAKGVTINDHPDAD